MSRLDDLRNEVEFRKCQKDPEYFLERYWHIRHPSKGRILFKMRSYQKDTLRALVENDRTIILKARQIGYSTLVSGYVFWLTFFHPDRFVIELSRTERESIDLLSKSAYGYRYLPDWMRQRGPALLSDHQQKMMWSNESGIESLPSRDNPARGRSVYLVVIDEWAFLPNEEEAWASVEPIADIGGRVIGLSTANGFGTFFHKMWVKAETGNSRFHPLFIPWNAVPERDDEWYRKQQEDLPEWQLHQEYPRNPEEAFLKSGNPYFDLDRLLQIEEGCEPPEWVGHFAEAGDRPSVRQFRFEVSPRGPLSVWARPVPTHRYVIGADVAEGNEHGDYSSAHVFDLNAQEVVAEWHGHLDPDLFGKELARLGWWYNTALIGVESNNHGLTTCIALKNVGYQRIYYRAVYDERTKKQGQKIGWRTSKTTRPMMLDELGAAIREGSLRLRGAHTVAELKTFVRDPDGKSHGSPFDDRTISLAIALQMCKHAAAGSPGNPKPDTRYTLDWFVRLADERDRKVKTVRMGAHNQRDMRPY